MDNELQKAVQDVCRAAGSLKLDIVLAASFLDETAGKKRADDTALLAAFKKGYLHQRKFGESRGDLS